MNKLELHNYQRKSVDFIKKKERCALFLSMGLGKTVISLTAIKELLQEKKILTVLIIAPLKVCNTTWVDELNKWSDFANLTYSLCTNNVKYKKTERKEKLSQKTDIYIINHDNVKWMLDNNFKKYGLIVVDESSLFKNPNSQRYKALKKFIYKYMILLSGTPAPNGLLDIWSGYYLLDKGKRLEKTIGKYKDMYFVPVGFYRFPKWKCLFPDKLKEQVEDITISLSAKDHLDLPKTIYYNTILKFSNKEHFDYLIYKKNSSLEVKDETLTAFSAGVLSNKLLQYCNGAVYNASKVPIFIHNHKIEALKTIIQKYSKENIIVAYSYESDLQRLCKAFPKGINIQNPKAVENWNKGKIKLLFANPASSGKGLNLQFGGNIVIWFSLTWNLEHYLQFNARLVRQGQTKPVIINHIIIENTIEEKVLLCLKQKNQKQNELLIKLKEYYN